MLAEPTEDQIKSRKALSDFIESMKGTVRKIGTKAKSEWFSRPDDELKGWIERGRAISEISDSMGYRLIMETTRREIEWAREQLELGKLDEKDLRGYLKGLRFLQDFILTTNRNADIATGILAGREVGIGKDTITFIRNARVES